MGRHADQVTERPGVAVRRRIRAALPIAGICLLLIGAILLGVWWWNIRSVTDPIDADPVDASAVVVSSPPCSAGSTTTVRISGSQPPVTATLSGCGFSKNQNLAVQYLDGHPQHMRLAGTSVASGSGLAGKLLPIGILAAGLVAVFAAIALLVERRRSRHLAAANRITVADLRVRGGASFSRARQAVTKLAGTPSAAHGDGDAGVDGTTGDAGAAPGGDEVPPASAGAGGSGSGGDGVGGGAGAGGGGSGIDEPAAGGSPDAAGEPAHVLPSGFVIVDEQLFTHSGSQAPAGIDGPG